MAKDERLYARFDIGMDEHPKIMLLSDTAFRTLIECTFYARRQITDGFLDSRVALKKWGAEALAELAANHPERPSLQVVDGGWQIRDYAEHQITRADIDVKREAGRKGGLAKAQQSASKNVAPATSLLQQNPSRAQNTALANGYETLAKTETETETETTTTEVVVTPRKRGSRIPEPFIVTREMREWADTRTPGVDVNSATEKFVNYWRAKTRDATKLDWRGTWDNWLISDYEKLRPTKPTKTEAVMDVLNMGARLQAEQDRKAIGS